MKFKPGTTRRTLIIAIAMFVIAIPVVPVSATDITDMTLTYDFPSQTLAVNVSHYTSNNKTHYVETIEIWRNSISVLNQTYENQTDTWGEYYTFSVPASVGDNLTVTATESKGNITTRWLIVTSSTTTTSITDTTSTTTTTTTDTTTTTTGTATTDSTETTTGPDNPDSQGIPASIGLVTGIVIILVVVFIIFFAWLNPDKVPETFKQLGTRIKDGLSRIWIGLGNLFGSIKTKVGSK